MSRFGLTSLPVRVPSDLLTWSAWQIEPVKCEIMKFLVTLEHDESGFIVVECPALPGCLSQGRTEVEALANIREAIEASLETRRKYGIVS